MIVEGYMGHCYTRVRFSASPPKLDLNNNRIIVSLLGLNEYSQYHEKKA